MGSTGVAVTPPWCHGRTTGPRQPAAPSACRATASRATAGTAAATSSPDRDPPGPGGSDHGEVAFPVGPVDPHPVAGQPAEGPAPWGARRCCPRRRRSGRRGLRWPPGRPGSASLLPWCGTFRTSARRSIPSRTSRASASAPRSPVNRTRTPWTVTRATIDRSFGDAAAVARAGSGASTSTATAADPAPVARHQHRARASGALDEPVERADPVVGGRQRRRRHDRRRRGRPAPRPGRRRGRRPGARAGRAAGCRCRAGRRQRSTALTSGPVSTSTPAPGPAGRTSASPCPTSQATTTVPVGRPAPDRLADRPAQHDDPDDAPPAPAGAAAAPATARGRPPAARRRAATAPVAPAGQPPVASGHAPRPSRPPARASAPASRRARPARPPPAGTTAATRVASRPSTVAGATAGAASRLAGSETRLIVPERPATIGAVARPAAALTASASARTAGQPRSRSRRDQPGASRTIAAVAATDRAKPASRARPGSCEQQHAHGGAEGGDGRARPARRQRHQGDRAHRGRPQHARPRARRARRTRPAPAPRPRPAPAGRPPGAAAARARRSATMATFAPDTAVRCVSPARLKSAGEHRVQRAGVAHDQTRAAGPRAARRAPAPAEAARPVPQRAGDALQSARPARRRWAVRGQRRPRPRRRPRRGSDAPTRALTASPGSTSAHSCPAANSRTAASSRYVRSPSTSRVTVASAMNRGAPAPGQPVRARRPGCEDDGHGLPRLGERPQRRGLPGGAADRRHQRRHRERREHPAGPRRAAPGRRLVSAATRDGERDRADGARPEPERGEIRRRQAGAPTRWRRPGPAGGRPRSTAIAGRAALRGPRHTVTSSASSAARAGPMPGTSSSWSTLVNGPCVAVVDDALGQDRADAGQRVELGGGGRVQVELARRGGRAAPAPGAGRRRARDPHDDLLAVGDDGGEVDRRRVGVRAPARRRPRRRRRRGTRSGG